jgi:hypothetical protein
MKCRHCKTDLTHTFVDLGSSPPSNSYLTVETIKKAEKWYPLKTLVCTNCWLVQTEDFVRTEEMFSEDYAYFSSFSKSWLDHAKAYVDLMVDRFKLTKQSNIVEVAANDGYLLQFAKRREIPCYGIEPTHSTAIAAKEKGIEIIEDFFGVELANNLKNQGRQADLMAANNVLAHVPNINDFVRGFSILLNEKGVATFEFPHLLNLVNKRQFDTIYHEHYSYLSLISVKTIFEANGLSIFDVDKLPTHGGSLRIYAQRSDIKHNMVSDTVFDIYEKEIQCKVNSLDFYREFQRKSEEIKFNLLSFLIELKSKGKKVIAYGAAAKGNTVMNFSGIRPDLIPFVVDKNPNKSGKFMPGSRIPIVDESIIKKMKPEYIIILPWNLKNEIEDQLSYIRDWKGQFIVAIPELKVF